MKGETVDVAFAISATSQDSSGATFQLMQNSIKSIIETYGATSIHYGLMVFGDRPKTLATFGEGLSPKDFKRRLESASAVSGVPDLKTALEQGKKLFDGPGARPNAKRFLVIITDSNSENDKDDLKEAGTSLIEAECWVIPVQIGTELDPEEFHSITPVKNNIVKVPKTENPEKLAEKITAKMKERKFVK